MINTILDDQRFFLMEHESKDLISHYDIPVGKYKLAKNESEAIEFGNEIGYPLVIKLMSPDIVHKTEAGIIKLNIHDEEELKRAYNEVLLNAKKYNPNAVIVGINIQKMMNNGVVEIIIGGMRDVNFGPVLMCGLGGIFVEIFKDVSYRVCPITEKEALKMIKSIKAFPLLDGYRGAPKADLNSIVNIIMKCCRLMMENPDIENFDLNPVIVFKKGEGAVVVDARIILKEEE